MIHKQRVVGKVSASSSICQQFKRWGCQLISKTAKTTNDHSAKAVILPQSETECSRERLWQCNLTKSNQQEVDYHHVVLSALEALFRWSVNCLVTANVALRETLCVWESRWCKNPGSEQLIKEQVLSNWSRNCWTEMRTNGPWQNALVLSSSLQWLVDIPRKGCTKHY